MIVSWRGRGNWVVWIGTVPFFLAMPFIMTALMDTQPGQSISGYFAWPFLVSAGLTYWLSRNLERKHADRPHDLWGIPVRYWPFIFLALAAMCGIAQIVGA